MEELKVEARNRSRSKTPFLRSQCDSESCALAGEDGHIHHHHEKKTKSPTVQKIVEETLEIRSSSSPEKTKKTKSKTVESSSFASNKSRDGGIVIKTSDYSSDDTSPDSFIRRTRLNATNKTSTEDRVTTSYSSSSTKTTRVITSNSVPDQRESFQTKAINSIKSYLKTSTPKGTPLLGEREQDRHTFSSEFEKSSPIYTNNGRNGGLEEHPAYKEYKEAGDYWNKFPKTDYTYSKLSSHRREVKPGVVAMPNMSRRGLESHGDRVTYMVQRNPAQEEYIRRRYEYNTTASANSSIARGVDRLVYDSQDDTDYSKYENYREAYGYQASSKSQSWFTRVLTTIYSFLGITYSDSEDSYLYKTRVAHEERGFFGRIGYGISSLVLTQFQYIYFLISSVLMLDTKLLKTSSPDNRRKKRFLLFLLILLPLLLLSGLYYYLHPTEPFPPKSLSNLSISLPTVDFSKFCENDKCEELKDIAFEKLDNLRNLTTDYFAYLKTVSSNVLQEVWSPPSDLELRDVIQRSLSILPFTMSNLQNILPSIDLQQVLTVLKFQSSQSDTTLKDHLSADLKNSLSPEEYENVLNHINVYLQKLVDEKMEKHLSTSAKQSFELTPAVITTIADVVRENVKRIEPILLQKTEGDLLSDTLMQRIAERIHIRLEENNWISGTKMILSNEHLKQISNMIREHIDINNHQYNALENIDFEGLLVRILESPNLATIIDSRILKNRQYSHSGDGESEIIAQQQVLINELGKEINFMKAALSGQQTENQDLHYSIDNLKMNQEELVKRIDSQETNINNRFSVLLGEIEDKLSLLRDDRFSLINNQVKLSLIDILGYKDSDKVDEIDLKQWIRNTFIAKDYLEQRLLEISNRIDKDIKDEISHSGGILMKQISEKLKVDILHTVDIKRKEDNVKLNGEFGKTMSEDDIKRIVKEALAVYDADKTGMVDYALESAGGQILSTRCTESYQLKTAQISIFGIPLWYPTNTPRVAISPNAQPGECWAFQGFPGFLVLRLNTLINVMGFTMEHIPKTLTPNGKIDSAPRNFTVWGLEHENDHDPVLFGEYQYLDDNTALQYFPVKNQNINRLYDIVELRIETNHGNPLYTCLYRFRVHGKPPSLEV